MSQVYIVVGLGFGDEGKGSVVDYLARENDCHTVVRFNGGAQAAHNVVTPEGHHHTFAQFGSGTFAGARTHLSRFMLVNPFDIYNEAQHLELLGIKNPLGLVTVSPDALVTTPLHVAANQIREAGRDKKHGTCGKGIGETQQTAEFFGVDAIRVGDLWQQGIVERKLKQLSDYYQEELGDLLGLGRFKDHFSAISGCDPLSHMARAYRQFTEKESARSVGIMEDSHIGDLLRLGGNVIFEGAQGILLDQDFGFHPHTTWSQTTSHNAHKILVDCSIRPADTQVIAVTRAYMTRHGEGPFVSEGILHPRYDEHNLNDGLQGQFRFGDWDCLAARFAAACDGAIDAVAVTCLDQVDKSWATCEGYHYKGDMSDLDPYFYLSSPRGIESIYRPLSGQHSHMEAVTNRLKQCQPIDHRHVNVEDGYIADYIGKTLNLPVLLESYGPTHQDKIWQVVHV